MPSHGYPTPISVIQPMQKVQNAVARLIFRAPLHKHCTPLLQQLHWLPISKRIKYKTSCTCYNSITGSAPSYLCELLQLYSPSRSPRSLVRHTNTQTRTLQQKNSWLLLFLLFPSSHLEQPPHGRQTLYYSLLLLKKQKQKKLNTFLRAFEPSNTALPTPPSPVVDWALSTN